MKAAVPPGAVELDAGGFARSRALARNAALCSTGPVLSSTRRIGKRQPDRDHRLEEGVVEVVADAGHLAGGGHLDAQDRVGALEPREGELRRLDPHVVQLEAPRSSTFGVGRPMMTRVARSMKLTLKIFETKGKERDARRLHSMTMMSLSLAMNWMLNGPLIFSASAILRGDPLDARMVSM